MARKQSPKSNPAPRKHLHELANFLVKNLETAPTLDLMPFAMPAQQDSSRFLARGQHGQHKQRQKFVH